MLSPSLSFATRSARLRYFGVGFIPSLLTSAFGPCCICWALFPRRRRSLKNEIDMEPIVEVAERRTSV